MNRAFALAQATIADNDHISAAVAAQGPRLRAFVRRQIADVNEVEDIVQDAFAQLVSAYRLAEPIGHLAAWLRKVARNRIVDRFRKRSRQAPASDGTGPEDAPYAADGAGALDEWLAPAASGPEAAYIREMLADELVAALEELPQEQREVFIAHELDGHSFKQLAVRFGVGVNTLLGRKRAAVLHLRRRLQDLRSEFDH